jgi:predicted O-methyltransferase YrrM
MKKFDIKNDYERKLINFMIDEIKDQRDLKILEFGVRKGVSTKFFLEICKKNNGKLYSVDIDNCSNLFNDDNWKFIHCRDDDFKKIEKEIPNEFDLIYLDSYHEPNHVEKIINYYYPKLRVNGLYVIDDICWIPYVKNNYRDSFGNEKANIDTFNRILELYFTNKDNFDLDFTFVGSGLAKIFKRNSNELNYRKNIPTRSNLFKNFIKKIIKR